MKSKCDKCGRTIYLVKTGTTENSYKWVTDPSRTGTWHCGNDPAFPVLGHKPKEANVEE